MTQALLHVRKSRPKFVKTKPHTINTLMPNEQKLCPVGNEIIRNSFAGQVLALESSLWLSKCRCLIVHVTSLRHTWSMPLPFVKSFKAATRLEQSQIFTLPLKLAFPQFCPMYLSNLWSQYSKCARCPSSYGPLFKQ